MSGGPGSRQIHRGLFLAFFVNFLFFGVGVVALGAVVPRVLREFGWSYLLMGEVLAAGSVGYLGSTFLCGILIHKWGPRSVIVAGLGVQGAGLALFGLHPSAALNLLAMGLVGLGEGGTEVVTNYCMVRMEPPGQSRLMNLMHAAFTIGAIGGALGVGALLGRGIAWQAIFRILALLCWLVAGVFRSFAFASLEPSRERTASSRAVLARLARQPLLILLGAIIFLYVGLEMGISDWVAEYHVRVLGFSSEAGAYMVSVFWAGLLLGRLVLSAAYRGRPAPLLFVLTLLATLFLALALKAETPLTSSLFFWCVGLGLSAVYPVVIVLTGQLFEEEQGMAIGVVSAAGGVGSLAIPFAMSAIAHQYSLVQGFWFYLAVSALMAGAAAAVLGKMRRRKL